MASKLSCCRKWHHYCLHITSTFGFSSAHCIMQASPLWWCILFSLCHMRHFVETYHCRYLGPPHLKKNPMKINSRVQVEVRVFRWSKWIAKSRCVVRSDVMYAMGTHNLHFEGLWPISSLDRNTPMFYSLWVYLRPRWCFNQLHRKYMR